MTSNNIEFFAELDRRLSTLADPLQRRRNRGTDGVQAGEKGRLTIGVMTAALGSCRNFPKPSSR